MKKLSEFQKKKKREENKFDFTLSKSNVHLT